MNKKSNWKEILKVCAVALAGDLACMGIGYLNGMTDMAADKIRKDGERVVRIDKNGREILIVKKK